MEIFSIDLPLMLVKKTMSVCLFVAYCGAYWMFFYSISIKVIMLIFVQNSIVAPLSKSELNVTGTGTASPIISLLTKQAALTLI